MKVAFVYANSWEFAYPQYAGDIDRLVWTQTDDFIMKYPRAVQALGVEPVLYYLSQSAKTVGSLTHKYGFGLRRVPVRFGAGHLDREFSLRLLGEVERGKYDLIHVYHYYRNRRYPDMFDLFALYAKAKGLRFVAHYQAGDFPHGNPVSRLKRAILHPRRLVKRAALNAAERIFSLNKIEIEALTNPAHDAYYGFPFPRDKCVYLPNIVDPALFSPMDRTEACRQLNIDPRFRYVLYVGFLRPRKGVQDVIAVMPRLRDACPDVRLLIVGRGVHETCLRRQVQELRLEADVIFAGPVPNDRLRPYYNAAAVHVLPSYAEGMPSVVLEALACNVPTVGSRVGGIPEALSDGAGLLAPPGDCEAWLAALRRVLEEGFAIPPAVRDRRLQEYSFETAGRILYETYREILDSRSNA